MAACADLSLLVNGTASTTVSGGDRLTLSWTATPDVSLVARSWGPSGTHVSLPSGQESIPAPNPTVPTSYSFSLQGYDGAQNPITASVQVNVMPNPAATAPTPLVWTPSLGFYPLSILSFYIVPDAEIGTPYSATLSATGREPITYGAAGLPDGLSVVGNTIVGTPTPNALLQGGNFTLTATDGDGYTYATLARMMTPVLAPRNLPAVQAPVVFDGGAPILDGAYVNDPSAGPELAGSGFMLKNATSVTGVRVWGTYLARFKAASDNFTIRFYDHGPSPIITWPSFPAAGRLIGTFTPTSVSRSRTGRAVFGVLDSEYVYDLGFSGLNLQSNTLYYVCVANNTGGEQWACLPSVIQNYPSWGAYSQDGGLTLPGGSFELAFQLREGTIVTPPPPPPSTNTVTYKLDIKRNGKGTVTFSPTGSSSSGTVFAPGTVVTITATPDPTDRNSIWKGWTGDVISSSQTITVTMSRTISVQANFR